jgi:hypothetical protein
MQINQGFDPNGLNISTLAKTSCNGCPVQYYSGTYGSGVYTRTIPVVAAPAITGWCFGATGCSCGVAPGSGAEQGGQPFRLCGTGFQSGAVAEFDGIAATGCAFVSASAYTCTGTPPHAAVAGAGTPVAIRLRNPDTRTGYASAAYTYGSGASRTSGLLVSKSNNDALLHWDCTGCIAGAPARVYRSQDPDFTLNVEHYNGGIGGTINWPNVGALAPAANPSYFWVVE